MRVLNASDVDASHRTLADLEAASEEMDAEPEIPAEVFDELPIDDLKEDLAFRYPHMADTSVQSKIVATQMANTTAHAEDVRISCRRPDFEKMATAATAAERGTATHLFLRYADYAKLHQDGSLGVEEELERLQNQGFMDRISAKAVLKGAVEKLFRSELGEDLASLEDRAIEVRREFPFSVLIPAAEINETSDKDDSRSRVLLQGVIDLFFIDESNGIHVIDFKTDWISNDADEEEKASRYKSQLDVYARALQEIYDGTHIAEETIVFVRNGHKKQIPAA